MESGICWRMQYIWNFVRRILPNLELGAGLALNNAFGYPMAFPALYVNWNYGHKLTCSFSALDGANLAVGYNVDKAFSISFITEMGGQMALTELNGDDSGTGGSSLFKKRKEDGRIPNNISKFFK